MGRHFRRLAASLLVAGIGLAAGAPAALAAPAWLPSGAHVAGIHDLGGPRSDGKLVVAGSGKLFLMDATGTLAPFAQGPGGYADDKGAEAYLAVSPGLNVATAGCSFAPDDVYIERLHAPIGITKVDASGKRTNFVNTPVFSTLSGIAFDTTGDFDHRLLVVGAAKNGERLLQAIDCNRNIFTINGALPASEGGLAVAPASFGAFAGELIAPDENSGNIYAYGAKGTVDTVIKPALPTGGDVGVEDAGFVPAGFLRGGTLYFADRLTPGGKHPGSDSVLTLSSGDLAAAGVQEGDLLVATEGGGQLIAVRCIAAPCQVITVVGTATKAHGEGHLAFITTAPPPSPSPPPTSTPVAATTSAPSSVPVLLIAEIVVVVVLIGLLAVAVVRRR